MSITLVVLAAGIGSRYGGLKQIDPVGPSGEIVIDYAIHDALQAGFDKVVCVIRRDIEKDFKSCIASHFEKHIRVEYAFQDMLDLPPGFSVPSERKKPWGTAHAIRACRHVVKEPFAVINADDFYGAESFRMLGEALQHTDPDSTNFNMVGFVLRNTLTEHGSVARGICQTDAGGMLTNVVERTKIEKLGTGAFFTDDSGHVVEFSGDELVSMNMWGFTPAIFEALEHYFITFLKNRGLDSKAEYFIPTVVDAMIRNGEAQVKVLRTPAHWFGVTYPQDKPLVVKGIRSLIDQGRYPVRLWG
jgi:dTDP-glucose pyrophosphorylase